MSSAICAIDVYTRHCLSPHPPQFTPSMPTPTPTADAVLTQIRYHLGFNDDVYNELECQIYAKEGPVTEVVRWRGEGREREDGVVAIAVEEGCKWKEGRRGSVGG